ncbi:MAG: cobalt ECF transporter T component CbiQ [Anaerolineaceae bacterium]
MDARVKLIFTLAFILFLNMTPSGAWAAFILFAVAEICAILHSRLSVKVVLRRALLAAPFMLAAVPLIFTGPEPHRSISLFSTISVPYSPAGFVRFLSIAIKSWMSVQAAILLTSTTPFTDLLVAMRALKMPKIFVAIIGLMWRYLFVIGDEVTRMLHARASRSASLPGNGRAGGKVIWRAKVTGGMAGSLFLRSLERSDRVYAAMLARGYNGEPPAVEIQPISTRQWLVLGAGLLLLVFFWVLGAWMGG